MDVDERAGVVSRQGVGLPFGRWVDVPRVVANQTATMQSKNVGTLAGCKFSYCPESCVGPLGVPRP